ncbi:uncharacterized protein BDW70DRAFT_81809 [Aspergillus foveolatus]|uniref:uncharacterized protein n=1 Tax=Aspergillus foveolatus TaxID=210207 RepID=UPI003CCDC69F
MDGRRWANNCPAEQRLRQAFGLRYRTGTKMFCWAAELGVYVFWVTEFLLPFSVLRPLFRSFVVIVVPRTLQTKIRPVPRMTRLTRRNNSNRFHLNTVQYPVSRSPLHSWNSLRWTCMGFLQRKPEPSQIFRNRCRNQILTAASLPGNQLSPIIREYTVLCPSTEQTTVQWDWASRPVLPTESPAQESLRVLPSPVYSPPSSTA